MSPGASPGTPGDGLPGDASAGELLRAAREAHGVTIETVAQHLKLAPRQVRALEEDAYQELPGRTFVRGFARNYAKLMRIDADAVVAALPSSMAPAIVDNNPATISPGVHPIGELPVSGDRDGVPWSRWAIALVLIVLIGAAVVYEMTRRGPLSPDDVPPAKGTPVDPIGPGPTAGGTLLPNPLAGGDPLLPADAPREAAPVSGGATDPASPAPAAPAQAAAAAPTATTPAAAATLVITYRAAAWTEVRDASNERLVVGTMPAGTSQTITGVPPLELTLGNAMQTSVTWRGAPFDLAPHIKQNIARVRLQ